MWRSAQEDAIWGVDGNCPYDMLADHIYMVNASCVLWSRKRHVHRIRWILLVPDSWMVALVSKYAIDARIGGLFKPTYLEMDLTHPKIVTHQKN